MASLVTSTSSSHAVLIALFCGALGPACGSGRSASPRAASELLRQILFVPGECKADGEALTYSNGLTEVTFSCGGVARSSVSEALRSHFSALKWREQRPSISVPRPWFEWFGDTGREARVLDEELNPSLRNARSEWQGSWSDSDGNEVRYHLRANRNGTDLVTNLLGYAVYTPVAK